MLQVLRAWARSKEMSNPRELEFLQKRREGIIRVRNERRNLLETMIRCETEKRTALESFIENEVEVKEQEYGGRMNSTLRTRIGTYQEFVFSVFHIICA
jgi:predicted alpha/beta-hydrolase family hydrolase